jgi:hypothetical protein
MAEWPVEAMPPMNEDLFTGTPRSAPGPDCCQDLLDGFIVRREGKFYANGSDWCQGSLGGRGLTRHGTPRGLFREKWRWVAAPIRLRSGQASNSCPFITARNKYRLPKSNRRSFDASLRRLAQDDNAGFGRGICGMTETHALTQSEKQPQVIRRVAAATCSG